MGKVYRAEQIPLGRPVALKVLHARHTQGAEGPSLQKRFLREASILSKLQHPNIVTVFDYGKIDAGPDDDERLFMAMEYLSGETLLQRLITRGRLSWQETVNIGKQLARGLREAHNRGVVHRDLKPSNVMILRSTGGEERIKIVDFGIVKVLEIGDNDQELTQEGSVVGSPNYMSPEQISTGKVDPRSDMYSLGVILYQCLTGKFPFDAESPMQMMVAHVSKPPIPILDRAAGLKVPVWLDDLIMRCLQKGPDKRPSGMDEVLRAIQGDAGTRDSTLRTPAKLGKPDPLEETPPSSRAVLDEPPPAAQPVAPPEALASVPLQQPRRSLWPVAFLVIVSVLAVVGVFFLREEAPPPPALGYTLTLDSEPSGAEVFEDEKRLGTTPLELQVQNANLEASPRTLRVESLGMAPKLIQLKPSKTDLHLVATLAAASAAPAAPSAVPEPTSDVPDTSATTPTVPRVTGPAPAKSLDIKMTR